MYVKFVILLLIYFLQYSDGQLLCYVCGFSSVDSDRSCLTITNSTQTVDCSFKYCTIMRQEFLKRGATLEIDNRLFGGLFVRIPALTQPHREGLPTNNSPNNRLSDPRGVVASFTRSCLQSPDFLNHEVTDSTFRTFYRACTSDLCNVGDGIESVTGSNLSPRPISNATNLLVPGTGRI